MTNREKLKEALDEVWFDECTDEKGKKLCDGYYDMPLCAQWFIMNMAAILVGCAEVLLSQDFPQLCTDDNEVIDDGKADTSIFKCVKVLMGADLFRGSSLGLQLHGFLKWWLSQEAEDAEDIEHMWYDFSTLGEKWNEYAINKQKVADE